MSRLQVYGTGKRKFKRSQVRLIALSHYASYFLASKMPKTFPILFVVGYPKCGTTWVCQLMADYFQIPFANQSLLPVGMQSVMHGHQRIWPDGPPAAYVLRDGRDAMVSMYFYLIRGLPDPGTNQAKELAVGRDVRRYFENLHDRNDIRANLPYFIEQQMMRPHGCRTNWAQHIRTSRQAGRTDVPFVKYEDLLADGPGTLASAVQTLTGEPADMDRCRQAVEKYAFKRQAGRDSGQENRKDFLRKGQAGDWRNHFSREAAEVFDRHAGDMLIELGYEKDRSWVQQCG
jgi:Sulfotransferase domain